jgi:geranylgeranyl diphosphate synthase type II
VFDLADYVEKKRQTVDAALKQALDIWIDRSSPTPLIETMRYSVEAGGKRLRPILCIAACEAVGGKEVQAMDAACALEFIHTYSLIHDDLPAMDDDDLRRGKPTCHKAFGEAAAVLAGDALLTGAFEILAGGAHAGHTDPAIHLEVIRLIANAAGALGMVQGQMLDITLEGVETRWEQVERMQQLKTGALIKASVESGAILGGARSPKLDWISAFGANIGLAFQMIDDILNVEGNPKILGKPVGSDETMRKATSPAVLGLQKAKNHAARLVDLALSELIPLGTEGQPLAGLARFIVERKN